MHFKTLLATLFTFISLHCTATPSLQEMTLEEKIGQLLMVHFNGEIANNEAQELIQEIHVGGIIYYNWANDLSSPEQVLRLSKSLQAMSLKKSKPIPLFLAVDQEGGIVSRLNKGFTIFPGNKALGMTGEPKLAEESAFIIGQEMHAVGVNFNLSPVIDINSNPKNPIIGIRSFGDSANTVISFGKHALDGYHKAGIITSLKHYPGHGDVEVDSHQDLPLILKSRQQLQELELLPFYELASQADTVMTAHILVPSIDPINCITLSKTGLDLLRNDLGFEGVIIADSLVMEGLLKNCACIDDAAIKALNAGCDILMLGGRQLIGSNTNLELKVTDIKRIHLALINAVKNGQVSVRRVDEAVQRILNLKNRYKLFISEDDESKLKTLINTASHQQLAKKIASQALNIVNNKETSFQNLKSQRVAVFASTSVKDAIEQTPLNKLGKENCALYFSGLSPTKEEISSVYELVNQSDFLIFCSYNAWKNPSQIELYQQLLKSNKPIIVVSLRDSLDVSFFSQADLIISTFSPTLPSIQAVSEYLMSQ